jgi:hypothetical protein
MGADYYTQDQYCFVHTSADGKEKTFYEEAGGRQAHYLWNDYDSDVMTLVDYLDEVSKKMNEGKPTLYEDGKWKCTPDCQERLQKILEAHPHKKFVKIYKCVFVWPRY